jgi:hypothetical protein
MKPTQIESSESAQDRPGGRRLAAVFAGVILAMAGAGVWFYQKADGPEAFAVWCFRSALILALIFGFAISAVVVGRLLWQRKMKFHGYARSLIEASLDPKVWIEGRINEGATAYFTIAQPASTL